MPFLDHGQLVLERGTVRNPGDRRPQQRVRRLAVLNSSTLETVFEATLPDDVGGLATISNRNFYFVRRNGPMDLKIVQASLR